MNPRSIARVVQAQPVSEGAGVTVHRTIGTQSLRNFDPFLMLDHFGSDNPNEYIAGFPDHPHRGFITFTYMLDGHMLHRDSMGNRGDLHAGGAQWMKAAAGVIHSEMPQQTHGLMRGFQLWINLPAKEKMSQPEYQEFTPGAIPEVKSNGVLVRVLAGEFAGVRGVVEDPFTQVRYFDIRLDPGTSLSTSIPEDHSAFVYVFEGTLQIGETELPTHSLGLSGQGDSLNMAAGKNGARLVLVSGRPIQEPIVQYGPFVMNNRAEIEQAFADFHSGRFASIKANMRGH
ncbi:MAG: pirin family protein [Silvanigrellaceae bacterium]